MNYEHEITTLKEKVADLEAQIQGLLEQIMRQIASTLDEAIVNPLFTSFISENGGTMSFQ